MGTGDANETNAFLNQAVPGAKAEYAFWGGGSRWVGNGRHIIPFNKRLYNSDLCVHRGPLFTAMI